MSGTPDKKNEKNLRRAERTRKEQQEKRRLRIISISVVIVFALLLIGALFVNSKYVRRTLPAITIGGVSFSAAEFDYYYTKAASEYSQYMSQQLGDYASMYLPSSETPHKNQIYDNETGETWADFFTGYATDMISELVKYNNDADQVGFITPEDNVKAVDDEIEYYKMYAQVYGYPSLDSFLQKNFGLNANEQSMRKAMLYSARAAAYGEFKRNSFTYSDAEKTDYYSEKRDSLDSFTYRYFLMKPEDVSSNDYETEEKKEEAVQAAKDEAKALADAIAAEISSEEDFINAAREYDPAQYEEPDSTLKVYPGSWLGSIYGDWLKDEARQNGDVTAIDSTSGVYLVFFIERDNNEYQMPEMRQILIKREAPDETAYESGKDDPLYLAEWEAADSLAKEKAETMVEKFVTGGATEALLLELMEEYTDDTKEGGFYDKISRNQETNKMVPDIEKWLFAPERKYGDYELIRTEEYGYHFVFFMGLGVRFCDYLADRDLRNADYNAWVELLPAVDSVRRWAFMFTSN